MHEAAKPVVAASPNQRVIRQIDARINSFVTVSVVVGDDLGKRRM